jgi:NADH dehydrogenase
MKVFVTGATGFVGRHIVELLLEKGHTVRILTHRAVINESWNHQKVECVTGDVGNAESLRGQLAGSDAVIHLVGIIVESGENTFERVHFQGARNLLAEAVRAGASRFVHMSALGSRNSAASCYHITKFMAEKLVEEAPIAQTIFRPSVIFGKGDEFTKQIANVIRYSPIVPVIQTNSGRLQPVSVNEVAHCFVDCLERVETFYQTYELGGPATYTLRELMETFTTIMGKKRVFLPVPAALMAWPAMLMERLPLKPPITLDQLRMIGEDNTCNVVRTQQTFGVPKIRLEDWLKVEG